MLWGSFAKLRIKLIPYSLFLSKHNDSEHLSLVNNFTITKKFFITKLDNYRFLNKNLHKIFLFPVVLIGYLFVTSLVGLYTIPVITRIRPMLSSTPLTHLILNCCIYVILSTALPLLAKILGK